MQKPVPVLQLNQFHPSAALHSHFYVQPLKEHFAHYQFVKLPHRHDFYCVFWFTQGSGNHVIDYQTYPVTSGSVFFMSPAQVHSWQLSEDTDGYVIFFNAQFYLLNHKHRNVADFPFFHYTARPCLLLEESGKEIFGDLFTRIVAEYQGHEQRKDEILGSYLNVLLIKLSNIYTQTNQLTLSSHLVEQIRNLESLIEQHFLEHKSVEDYAGLMHLSVKQLYAICQTALQKSPSTLLQERILLEAKRLLVHTDLTIAQIATQLNYMDNSYFNRFFKRTTGLTPEQFRQQYR